MNARNSLIAFSLLVFAPMPAWAQGASFGTLITTPLAIEGLTNDNSGNLYTPGRSPGENEPCPVWRVKISSPSLVLVGNIPAATPPAQCSPSGLAFNRAGKLFVTQGSQIYSFFPNSSAPPTATLFASGVPGTNGLAFDRAGNLWTGDGTTGLGRVWKINTSGVVTEVFRVQPMVNVVPSFTVPNPPNAPLTFTGVGRDIRTVPTGNSQPLVANGLQFTKHGDLLIADTARGAIWKVRFDRDGNLRSKTGCDSTFTDNNTLCLENNILVQHPLLDGADGLVLDRDDNIWVSANERNAMVFVSDKGEVFEVFRSAPDAGTQLRNTGPLEFPASPALSNLTLCTSNSDGNRRDNSPNSAGEIPAPGQVGKISCMDRRVHTRGATLPVR